MNVLHGMAAISPRSRAVMCSGKYRYWNLISIVLLVSMLAGCTTLRPIDVDAVTLHQKIRSGDAVKVGDTIRAITIDGVAHLLYVTAVDEYVVEGHPPGAGADVTETVLPIDDIVLIEVDRLSADNARTFASGTGVGAVAVGILFLIGIISF